MAGWAFGFWLLATYVQRTYYLVSSDVIRIAVLASALIPVVPFWAFLVHDVLALGVSVLRRQ